MKFIFITIFSLYSFTPPALAQEYSQKFGEIGQAEWKLKELPADPEVDAVILFDIGESTCKKEGVYDFLIEYKRSYRAKILKRSGIGYGEFYIAYYEGEDGKSEKIKQVEAYTYNIVDGKVVKDQIELQTDFEEKLTDKWKRKKYVFSNVQEGSIIEYAYTLESPFQRNLREWRFQSLIPTVFSQYTINLLPEVQYDYVTQSITEFDNKKISDSPGDLNKTIIDINQKMSHTFIKRDVPAFKDTEFISTIDNYIIKIEFRLNQYLMVDYKTTWKKLIDDLSREKRLMEFVELSKDFSKRVFRSEIDISEKGENDICKTIINYVKNNFIWNGDYGVFPTKSARDFYKQRTGNYTEINLFMMTLLQEAGINAESVILSTRSHGKIDYDAASLSYFNARVLLVKESRQAYLADGTRSNVPYNTIPVECINGEGLLVELKKRVTYASGFEANFDKKERKINWVNLESNAISLDNKIISLTIDPENLQANASITIQSTGYNANQYRSAFNNKSEDLSDYF